MGFIENARQSPAENAVAGGDADPDREKSKVKGVCAASPVFATDSIAVVLGNSVPSPTL